MTAESTGEIIIVEKLKKPNAFSEDSRGKSFSWIRRVYFARAVLQVFHQVEQKPPCPSATITAAVRSVAKIKLIKTHSIPSECHVTMRLL